MPKERPIKRCPGEAAFLLFGCLFHEVRHAYCKSPCDYVSSEIQWQLLGLKAPAFLWLVSVCLIVYSIYVYRIHLKSSRNRQRVLALAGQRGSHRLRDAASARPGEGISRSLYDSMASVFDDLPLLQPSWRAVASCLSSDRQRQGRPVLGERRHRHGSWPARIGRPRFATGRPPP